MVSTPGFMTITVKTGFLSLPRDKDGGNLFTDHPATGIEVA